MENYDILKWSINKSVSIFEFQQYNKSHIMEVEREFMKIRTLVKKEIVRACTMSYKKYKDEKKITIEDEMDDEENESEEDIRYLDDSFVLPLKIKKQMRMDYLFTSIYRNISILVRFILQTKLFKKIMFVM